MNLTSIQREEEGPRGGSGPRSSLCDRTVMSQGRPASSHDRRFLEPFDARLHSVQSLSENQRNVSNQGQKVPVGTSCARMLGFGVAHIIHSIPASAYRYALDSVCHEEIVRTCGGRERGRVKWDATSRRDRQGKQTDSRIVAGWDQRPTWIGGTSPS